MPGPLPTENPRHRGKPAMPTDALPLTGRDGDAPEPIEPLDDLERSYFGWAWTTPAAGAWHDSDVEIVAEWARLKAYASRCLRGEITKQTAAGLTIVAELSTAVLSQITAREDRLLLSPLARKKGRTKIVDDEPKPTLAVVSDLDEERFRKLGA